jgi:ribosomal protein S18 acetylase RimI-like enzyme
MTVSGVYTDNERARRLYERAGFRITAKIPAGAGRFQWTMTLPLDV